MHKYLFFHWWIRNEVKEFFESIELFGRIKDRKNCFICVCTLAKNVQLNDYTCIKEVFCVNECEMEGE